MKPVIPVKSTKSTTDMPHTYSKFLNEVSEFCEVNQVNHWNAIYKSTPCLKIFHEVTKSCEVNQVNHWYATPLFEAINSCEVTKFCEVNQVNHWYATHLFENSSWSSEFCEVNQVNHWYATPLFKNSLLSQWYCEVNHVNHQNSINESTLLFFKLKI